MQRFQFNTIIFIALLGIALPNSSFAKKRQVLLQSNSKKHSSFVIYGKDNRKDFHSVKNKKLLTLTNSVVSLVPKTNIRQIDSETSLLSGGSFGDDYGLCESERFFEKQTIADCSGVFIGENKILTAGHCVKFCNTDDIVFGFSDKTKNQTEYLVKSSNIYQCQKVITHYQDPQGKDFAVLELDRKVTNHKPLTLNPKKTVNNVKLITIGYPSGLSVKIEDDGSMRNNKPKDFFVAELDTYGGNSGSPVINQKTGLVEGILVRGEQDFTIKNDCFVSYRCKKGRCRGEDVIRSSVILPLLSQQ